ncbi:MAG: MFS transporter [Pseudomonadota bacterium]
MPTQSKIHIDATLLRIFGITMMVVMGVSTIMPILPLLSRTFNLEPSAIGAVLMVYTLPGIFLAPVSGVLADRLGRKKVLVPALILFALTGAACAFTNTLPQLLFFRFLQGMCVAPLTILYTTIIGDQYQGPQRMQAMGLNAAVLSLGTAIYPALGGLLGEIHWRAPFLLPLLALPLAFAFLRFPMAEPQNSVPLRDYLQNAKAIIVSHRAITLFCLTFGGFLLLYGPMVTYFPVLADELYSATPSQIGIIFSMASAGSVLTAVALGMLAKHMPEKWLFILGFAFYFLAMATMPHIPSLWWALLPIFSFGLAQGLTVPSVATMLSGLAPMESRGAVMAVNGTIMRLAQTVGPALFGLIYLYGNTDTVFHVGACIALITIPFTWVRLRSIPIAPCKK